MRPWLGGTLSAFLLLLPGWPAAAQMPGTARRDTLLLRFWQEAHNGALAGLACLQDRDDNGCNAMARHFLRADSLAREVDHPDSRHPVLVTDRQIPIRDAGWSLRVIADSVLVAARPGASERSVLWWGAQLTSVEVNAGLAIQRLRPECKRHPERCGGP